MAAVARPRWDRGEGEILSHVRTIRAITLLGLGLGLGLGAGAGGCLTIDPFLCQRDEDCRFDGQAGRCMLSEQTCVYQDPACGTQWSTAAGTCVVGPGSDDAAGDTSATPPDDGTSGGVDPDTGSTPDPDADGSSGSVDPDTSGDDGPEPTTGGPASCAGPTDDITAQGVVEASSVYNDEFHAYLAVDGNFGSSWFSSGPEPGGLPSVYAWSDLSAHCITQVTVTGNGLHSNPAFREDFGFENMIIRVYDGSDAVVYQKMFSLAGTPDPPVIATPNVEGVRVELELFNHESNDCGGFSEIEIVGD